MSKKSVKSVTTGPNPKIMAYIESGDPGCGKEFKPGLCKIRHLAAKVCEARGMRTEYEPCAYCPHFTEPAERPQAPPPTMCRECGQRKIRSGFELCSYCLHNFTVPKIEKENEVMAKKPERCSDCKAAITARAKANSGLCNKCYQRRWKLKKVVTPAEIDTIDAPKITSGPKPAQESHMNTERCNECQTPITAYRKSQSGLCVGCYRRKANEAKVIQAESNVPLAPESNMVVIAPKGPIDKMAEAGLRRKLAEFESELTPAPKPISLKPLEQLIEKYRYERESLIALINRLKADVKRHEDRLHVADMTLCDLEKAIEEMKQ